MNWWPPVASSLCLPVGSLPVYAVQNPERQEDEGRRAALAELGRTVRRLMRWTAADRARGAATPEPGSKTSGAARPARGAALQRACLLTPTHPPHFAHVALMLRAARRLALDPAGSRPPHVIVLDTKADAERLCAEQPSACANAKLAVGRPEPLAGEPPEVVLVLLKDLVEARYESWDHIEGIRKHYEADQEGRFRRFGSCGTGWGQLHQGLKKLFGMQFARQALGCELTWVVDSESMPLRPFRFADVFDAYRRAPWTQVQHYGEMGGVFGAPQLMFQECAHWIITHKFRRQAAGPFGYRQSDFWVYENRWVERFMAEVMLAWGDSHSGFVDWWMRPPAHAEGMVLPAWLHLRRARGALPAGAAAAPGPSAGALKVVDVAAAFRAAMPGLYAAACRNASDPKTEADCADDFTLVPRAIRALGLPEDARALGAALDASLPGRWAGLREGGTLEASAEAPAGPSAAAVRELLALLRLLDGLPLFGTQGHGQALGRGAVLALLPHWTRATSWCVSNCDWRLHAGPTLRRLGLGAVHREVLEEVPGYPRPRRADAQPARNGSQAPSAGGRPADAGAPGSPEQGRAPAPPAREVKAPTSWMQNVKASDLRCYQWYQRPNETVDGEAWSYQSWDTCLGILHYDSDES